MPKVDRLTVEGPGSTESTNTFASDVRAGLTKRRKTLPCKYFYDGVGSELFERICALPEYYVTRTERAILESQAEEIVSQLPQRTSIVELGSGSAEKTKVLLRALFLRQERVEYNPIDISESALRDSARDLLESFTGLRISAFVGEYEDGLRDLQKRTHAPRSVIWLGSSLGNLEPSESFQLLRQIAENVGPEDRLLVSIDLKKARDVLQRAYDDAQGVTAAFNLNILNRINRELGGEFDVRRFRHKAVYNAADSRVEMHLVSTEKQTVRLNALGITVPFDADESIHTENAYKFSVDEIDAIMADAGFRLMDRWLDPNNYCSVNVFSISKLQ